MTPGRDPERVHRRSVVEVLGASVLTGVIAGFATGAIDAVWSWSPAGQFAPGFGARLGFVGFVAVSHAAAGALLGVVLAGVLLVLSRVSRMGDLLRFAWRAHLARRSRDPREALAGLAITLAALPCIAIALVVAYRLALPFLATRKVMSLVVLVAMGAALAAVAVAIPVAFVIARGVEAGLRAIARPPRVAAVLSSPYAPLVVAGMLLAGGAATWVVREWETARVLALRGPFALVIGLVLAIPASRAGWQLVDSRTAPRWRRVGWIALPFVLGALVLAMGSAPAVKAASAYTGLGGPIARTVRGAFDWDRDGYARFLGGGDCDDGDVTVHPGAPEIPDDGIDQNCVGGDPSTKRSTDEVAFVAVPPGLPPDFRILLITVDTTRADHLGSYGYMRPTTPHLDRLAREGTLFEHAWAHAPSTRYSIPAILTGRLPLDVAYDTSVEGWPGLASRATTLAEAVLPFGFVGGAITNYWYFDRVRRMDQGIAEYDNENAKLHSGVSGAGPEQTKGSSSKEQTDKAIAFVDRHAADRWFLWVHYYDPHYAYEPHPGSPSFGTDQIGLYDGELRFTDHHIGRLLDHLRSTGLYDKTVVVVTGDHGEGFGEHGIALHGYHLYAAQTRVPLIVRVPGVPPRRSTTPAGHVDILPTLVNLAGGAPTADMMGMSLVGPITGADRERVVFQQLSYEGNHEMRGGASRACHVIYNVSPDTSWEVYRIDRDPGETADLAGVADACAATRRAVERWFDESQIPAGATEALLPARPAIAAPLDADLGDAVRLLSVEAPATAKPGEQISLVWTFETRARVAPGWKMFVHAQGPGRAFVNGDHRPARPFEWWRPGQFIRYTTTLSLPRSAPHGIFTVWAGMFKGKARAPARAPRAKLDRDGVAVATFEVVP